MSEEEKKITFKELVQARKEEMQHMRPGFVTIVTNETHSIEVSSPRTFDRSTFKMNK